MSCDLVELYFNWLLNLISQGEFENHNNIDIYRELFGTEFRWKIDRDENRAAWGLALRDKFADEYSIFIGESNDIFNENCSVLEMLIALAMDMDDILYDTACGSRIRHWFWLFLENLGVRDGRKCPDLQHKLDIFMDREYTFEGFGNIISIPNTKKDLRKVEIWYQICWYIDENY